MLVYTIVGSFNLYNDWQLHLTNIGDNAKYQHVISILTAWVSSCWYLMNAVERKHQTWITDNSTILVINDTINYSVISLRVPKRSSEWLLYNEDKQF